MRGVQYIITRSKFIIDVRDPKKNSLCIHIGKVLWFERVRYLVMLGD